MLTRLNWLHPNTWFDSKAELLTVGKFDSKFESKRFFTKQNVIPIQEKKAYLWNIAIIHFSTARNTSGKLSQWFFFISNEYTVVHLWTIRCLQNNCCFCHSALNLCSCLCFSFNCFYQIIFSSKECFKLVLSSSSHNSPFTIILRTTLRFWWRDQVVSLFFIRWPNEK